MSNDESLIFLLEMPNAWGHYFFWGVHNTQYVELFY